MRARRTTLAVVLLAFAAAGCGGSGSSGSGSSGSGSSGSSGGAGGGSASTAGNELVVLQDDLHLQTVDNIVPVVNNKKLSPPLQQALDKVSAALSTDDLVALNKQVDVDRMSPKTVAQAYSDEMQLATGVTGGSGKIVVAAANFGENQILANLYAGTLKAAGFDASVKPVTNREVYEPALERGQLDVVPEYVGTLTEFLNKKANGKDAAAKATSELAATLTALKGLATPKGLAVLEPSKAADQNAFAVTKTFADANKLTKLSDLKAYQGKLTLGGPPECATRPFCQPGLEKTYGLKFDSVTSLDAGGPLTKTAIKQGRVTIGLVFSSDGSLSAR